MKVDRADSGAMTIEATGHLSIKAASISHRSLGNDGSEGRRNPDASGIADHHQLSEEERWDNLPHAWEI